MNGRFSMWWSQTLDPTIYVYICMIVYSRSNSLEPITRVELIHWAYKVSKLDCEIKASLWHGCNGSFIVLIKSFPLSAQRVSKEDSSSVHHSNQLLTESKAFAFHCWLEEPWVSVNTRRRNPPHHLHSSSSSFLGH